MPGGAARAFEAGEQQDITPASAWAGGWRYFLAAWGVLAAFVSAIVLPMIVAMVGAGWIDIPARRGELLELQGQVQAQREEMRAIKGLSERIVEELYALKLAIATQTPAKPPARAAAKPTPKPAPGLFGKLF
jgi:hypothetical protein